MRAHYTHEYDGNGNRIRRDFYDADRTSQGYQTRVFDDYGIIIDESTYSAEGRLQNRHVMEYDNRHRVIKTTGYDEEGNPIRFISYDGDGNSLNYTEYRQKTTKNLRENGLDKAICAGYNEKPEHHQRMR